MIIAWDIETCPTPLGEMTAQQCLRYERELGRHLQQHPEADQEEASRLVRSLHPYLGWICCVAMVRYRENHSRLGDPKVWVANERGGEQEMLAQVWEDLASFRSMCIWVTFNGKRFDAPFLRSRSLSCGIRCTRVDLFNTNPYQYRPHTDLSNVFYGMSLADVCDLLGVETSKGQMQGGDVAAAVASGRIDEVARYCAGDVRATMECYLKVQHTLM